MAHHCAAAPGARIDCLMTSHTKRRLAVLALALGLVAVAPYAFDLIAAGLGGARAKRRRHNLQEYADGDKTRAA